MSKQNKRKLEIIDRVNALADYILAGNDHFHAEREFGVTRKIILDDIYFKLKKLAPKKYSAVIIAINLDKAFTKDDRIIEIAEFIIANRSTYRAAAVEFLIDNHTVANYMDVLLENVSEKLYSEVQKIKTQNKPDSKSIDEITEELLPHVDFPSHYTANGKIDFLFDLATYVKESRRKIDSVINSILEISKFFELIGHPPNAWLDAFNKDNSFLHANFDDLYVKYAIFAKVVDPVTGESVRDDLITRQSTAFRFSKKLIYARIKYLISEAKTTAIYRSVVRLSNKEFQKEYSITEEELLTYYPFDEEAFDDVFSWVENLELGTNFYEQQMLGSKRPSENRFSEMNPNMLALMEEFALQISFSEEHTSEYQAKLLKELVHFSLNTNLDIKEIFNKLAEVREFFSLIGMEPYRWMDAFLTDPNILQNNFEELYIKYLLLAKVIDEETKELVRDELVINNSDILTLSPEFFYARIAFLMSDETKNTLDNGEITLSDVLRSSHNFSLTYSKNETQLYTEYPFHKQNEDEVLEELFSWEENHSLAQIFEQRFNEKGLR